jgi:hypothetical protein
MGEKVGRRRGCRPSGGRALPAILARASHGAFARGIRLTTAYDDEFYRDILEGLSVYTGSAFQRDVLDTLSDHDAPALGGALNKNQIASKLWLAQALLENAGPRHPRVLVLGGWLGVLAAVLLHDPRFSIDRIVSVDIDASCAPVAQALNATHVRSGRFESRTADMLSLDYASEAFDLTINTSCEHLSDFAAWWARIPRGRLCVLQSNDYFDCDEHVNCVADLAGFARAAPLARTLFAGERRIRRYTRFMLIGER